MLFSKLEKFLGDIDFFLKMVYLEQMIYSLTAVDLKQTTIR